MKYLPILALLLIFLVGCQTDSQLPERWIAAATAAERLTVPAPGDTTMIQNGRLMICHKLKII